MRRLLIAAAFFVTIPSSPAFASSITINWTGNYVSFFNGDYFGLCTVDPLACSYGDSLKALGINIGYNDLNPWSLSMTFADATADAYGTFNTTVDIHFEIGKIGIFDRNLPVQLGTNAGIAGPAGGAPGQFAIGTRFATPAMGGGGPSQSVFFTRITNSAAPGISLVNFLNQQPLQSLSLGMPGFGGSCISVGPMDCDFMLSSETVSVSVPEPTTLISLSGGALLAFGFWRRRGLPSNSQLKG